MSTEKEIVEAISEKFGNQKELTQEEKALGHLMPELTVTDFPDCSTDVDNEAHTVLTWVCHDNYHDGCSGTLTGNEPWCHCVCHFISKNGPHWGEKEEKK